jgi:hypothetical protein
MVGSSELLKGQEWALYVIGSMDSAPYFPIKTSTSGPWNTRAE